MTRRGGRITIRGLMLATAGVTVPLLAARSNPPRAVVLAILGVSALLTWLAVQLPPAWARRALWGGAAALNLVAIVAALDPFLAVRLLLGLVWMVSLPPALAALLRGWDWDSPGPPRRVAFASLACVGPVITLWTCWPLHLATLALSAPLENLADRVAAAQPVTFPVRVGIFRFVGARVDRDRSVVALLTDADPNGPSGLVRSRPDTPRNDGCGGTIHGTSVHVALGGGWCYHEED